MQYLPLFADIQKQPCLVVGGGEVALRKVRQLLRAGARVTVNAPAVTAELAALVDDGQVHHAEAPFRPELIGESLLVFAATNDTETNHAVADACARAQRFCNVVDDREACSFIMPSIIDRAPITVAVSSSGEAPALARWLRQRIEADLPGRLAHLARWIGRWRKPVGTRLANQTARIGFWQRMLDGDAAAAVLDGREGQADALLENALNDQAEGAPRGEAWLVGAGPGDPELITLRGLHLLQRADAVLYDSLVNPDVLDFARRDADLVCVGKRAGKPSVSQERINAELVKRVRQGQRVCRLKGGDPLVFGRAGEEMEALAGHGLPFQVVPGITAGGGGAAYAGIPLTHRQMADRVTLITGHRADGAEPTDWRPFATPGHTLVVYMGARRIAEICSALQQAGRHPDTPAAIISKGTTEQQQVRVTTLAKLAQSADATTHEDIATPAVFIVGEVAALGETLNWFGNPEAQTAQNIPQLKEGTA